MHRRLSWELGQLPTDCGSPRTGDMMMEKPHNLSAPQCLHYKTGMLHGVVRFKREGNLQNGFGMALGAQTPMHSF